MFDAPQLAAHSVVAAVGAAAAMFAGTGLIWPALGAGLVGAIVG
ncbi:MAG: hypothetical protein AAF763_18735 [Pseudomonadota bacterium]